MRRASIVLGISLCAARAGAQDVTPRPSFVFARWASHSSLSLYAGYGMGRWVGVLGMVENPRTGYREALVGAGVSLAPGRWGSATAVLAGAAASDGSYLQLYVLPTFVHARTSLAATVELYAPLGRRGAGQYYLNPVTLLQRLSPKFLVGGTLVHFGQAGGTTGHGAGPTVQVVIPHGAITVDWLRGIANFRHETRLSFQSAL